MVGVIKSKLQTIDAQKVKQNVQLNNLPRYLFLVKRKVSKSLLLNELLLVIKDMREPFKGLKNHISTKVCTKKYTCIISFKSIKV